MLLKCGGEEHLYIEILIYHVSRESAADGLLLLRSD